MMETGMSPADMRLYLAIGTEMIMVWEICGITHLST